MSDIAVGDFLTRLAGKLSAAGVPHMVVASVEDTLISKLEWAKIGGGSELQLRDAAGILQLRGADLDLAYVERWVAELGLEDLRSSVKAAAS